MDRVFLDDFILEGEDYRHLIKVRRLKEGDLVEAVIENIVYLCRIVSVNKNVAKLEKINEVDSESKCPKIILYQSVLKKKKMETVLKNCTALGVYKFIPVVSKYTEPIKSYDFDTDRNFGILKEAAQQSKGNFIPKIGECITFEEAIKETSKSDISLILYEEEKSNYIKNLDLKSIDNISVFVGPEGGYHMDEINLAIENGIRPIRLFSRILRSEIVGFSAVSILISDLEDYESKN